jgi:hypothetical protein
MSLRSIPRGDPRASDRRQLWHNPLTNEENFGLVATDPGDEEVVVIDGAGRVGGERISGNF